jgi:hypothetical protein
VKLLRRVLYWGAAVSALSGVALTLVPSLLLHRIFQQAPAQEWTWARISGIEAVSLAMLMVLVAHRIEDLWWFCWAFAAAEGGIALVSALHAVFGLPEGSSAAFWWILAGVTGALTAGLLAGLARTGLERPPV